MALLFLGQCQSLRALHHKALEIMYMELVTIGSQQETTPGEDGCGSRNVVDLPNHQVIIISSDATLTCEINNQALILEPYLCTLSTYEQASRDTGMLRYHRAVDVSSVTTLSSEIVSRTYVRGLDMARQLCCPRPPVARLPPGLFQQEHSDTAETRFCCHL